MEMRLKLNMKSRIELLFPMAPYLNPEYLLIIIGWLILIYPRQAPASSSNKWKNCVSVCHYRYTEPMSSPLRNTQSAVSEEK